MGMPLLRTLLFRAARRLATDPRTRQMAADAYREEIKPRAQAAWQKAKPRVEETKADIGKIAEDTDARKHPARFAGRAARRVLDEIRGPSKNQKK